MTGVAVLLMALLTWIATRPAKGKWSTPSNGVQAMLSCGRSDYIVGEEIKVRVTFRNVGKTSRTIKMPFLYATIHMSRNKKGFADAIGAYPKGVDELRLLPGRKSQELLLCGCRTDIEGAGTYEFDGRIGGDGYVWDFEGLAVSVW